VIRPLPVLASVALHAAVFTGVMLVEPRQDSAVDEVVPIEFQLVEEQSAGTPAGAPERAEPVEAAPVEPEKKPVVEPEPAEVIDELPTEEPAAVEVDETLPAPPELPSEPPPEAGGEEERAEVVAPPEAMNRILPVYPKSARRRGREGLVTVEATIAADGSVEDVRVVSSSGHRDLDESAVAAVSSARFAPATLAGAAISAAIRLTFDFKLGK